MDKKPLLKYLLGLLLFGSNGVVASFIALSSYEIVFLRTVLGTVTIAALFLLTRQRLTAFQHKRDLLFVALSGVAMAANWFFLFEAYAQIGVSLAVLLNYTGPVIVVLFSALVFKERITRQKALALLAVFVGAMLISGEATHSGVNPWGLLCAVLSAVSYSAMVLCNKRSEHIQGMENSLLQIVFCLLTVTLFLAFRQGLHLEIAAEDWPWILWLGVVNTGFGCYLYFSSMGKLPVQTVAILGYLEPLSGVLFSLIFLGETMLPLQIAGAVLILGGAVAGEYKRRT